MTGRRTIGGDLEYGLVMYKEARERTLKPKTLGVKDKYKPLTLYVKAT